MFRKVGSTVIVSVACGLIGCAGPIGGKSQGESCSTEDECGTDLTCQPIAGHGDVCCPTPADTSTSSGCQAASDGG